MTRQYGRTVLSGCSFTQPLKVAKPIYHDDGFTEIMLMCASPGMLAGDRYDVQLKLGEGTQTIVSTQSYQKLLNTSGGSAEQHTSIQVGEEATLIYCPHPVIPQAGSSFRSQVSIELAASARLFYAEILTSGRQAFAEKFAFAEHVTRTLVAVEGRPVFLDGARLLQGQAALEGLGFFEGFACQGVFYLYGFDEVVLPDSYQLVAAVSRSYAGQTVRVLSDHPDSVFQYAQELFRTLHY
jgi:urease accessory protein